jgi:hypothetical protein
MLILECSQGCYERTEGTGKIVVKDIDDGRLDTNKPGRETINRILNNKGLENILLSPRQ